MLETAHQATALCAWRRGKVWGGTDGAALSLSRGTPPPPGGHTHSPPAPPHRRPLVPTSGPAAPTNALYLVREGSRVTTPLSRLRCQVRTSRALASRISSSNGNALRSGVSSEAIATNLSICVMLRGFRAKWAG